MTRLFCGAALVFSFVFLTARAGEAKKDVDALQGNWAVLSYEEAGKKAPAEETKVMEIIVRGEQMTIRDKDKIVLEFKFKIDPAKKPKTINFTHLSGDNKGETEQGIYVFEGDVVRMCIDDSGKDRPKEFKTGKDFPYSLVVMKKKAEVKK